MKLRNRGIIGSWEDGQRRTLKGAINTGLLIGIVGTLPISVSAFFNGIISRSTLIIACLFMVSLIVIYTSQAETGICYFLAWIYDNEDIVYR